MLVVNTDYIDDKEVKLLGLVQGSTVQSVNFLFDLTQALKTIFGGELRKYNDMMQDARNIATKRMEEEAKQMGADAIVNVRFMTSSIMQSSAEIIVYGTAVKFI